MKFSENWLRTFVSPSISTQELVDQLTMAGLEVDNVRAVAGDFTDVVVAKIETVNVHPDADKLHVCEVFDGEQSLQIVCGAENVRQGMLVPFARVGALLPGDYEIKPAKLRGVESFGMLCSEAELGMAEKSDGLFELSRDAPIGKNLRDYLDLNDQCIELDLTPNRGDCLSIAGIAREVGTLNQCVVTEIDCTAHTPTIKDEFSVEISATEACTHYVGRVIKEVNLLAITPLWITERLRRSGIRTINPIVDVTNYVMLELGQPMHAFDLETLDGFINVRYSETSEKITLLDGKCIDLDANSLLIADNDRPLAIAGIMGGEGSGVSDDTHTVFLESAFFKPEVISGKARAYGLHTDSSHRFERGVDPELQVKAIERATELIVSICGGKVGPVSEIKTEFHPDSSDEIHLRAERITRVLGIELTASEVEEILTRLGMVVNIVDDGWKVRAPSYRSDISIEADLLEELVRIYGYNNIPRTCSSFQGVMQPLSESEIFVPAFQKILVDRAYFEVITYSFVDPVLQQKMAPKYTAVALANPISSEMSEMRTTLWPGLLQVLQHNLNRQQSRVRLFETGLCFKESPADSLQQENRIAGVISGELQAEQWGETSRAVDFFDMKADVEALLGHLKEQDVTYKSTAHPALHPGQSANIYHLETSIGWMGALHPQVCGDLDLPLSTYLFELDLEAITSSRLPVFEPISRHPEVRRDLAILVEQDVPMSEILECIQTSATKLLKEVRLFDIYAGKGVKEGLKSVAFGLILQDFSRTLTDEEIDAEIEIVILALKQNLTATLRE